MSGLLAATPLLSWALVLLWGLPGKFPEGSVFPRRVKNLRGA